MTSSAELRINLTSLQRQDKYIEKITDSSTHVAVYSFSPQSSEWEKTDVEGALFVYKRVAPPHWGFTILNRLSMENLTEPLTSQLEFQTQNPFLLYRNAKLLIYGIWFYDQDDCQRIGGLLEKLCRESSNSAPNDVTLRKINIFDIAETKEPKSTSPTSNSVNSISPGSSVGGVQRPPSNGEADSESEDKEVSQSNKGPVDIMDLLCKAQNKYEKEKRNTPDPTMDLQNGVIVSPSETELPIVKPLAVKPVHPQKLDVASLFKQQPPKPPEAIVATNGHSPTVPMLTAVPTMTGAPYVVIPQQMVKLPQPSGNVNIPQPPRRTAVGRSFSMSDMGMRQNIDNYMNGNVMSVEEVEANINRSTVVNRQQQVNYTLDRMIDKINSSGGLQTQGSGMTQLIQLPGIQEAPPQHFVKAATGNSGGMVVNGNKTFFSDSDTFSGEITAQIYKGVTAHVPIQTYPMSSQRQRSISTSGVQPPRLGLLGPANQQPPANFPVFPNASTLSNHVIVQAKSLPVSLNTAVPTVVPPQVESGLLLHGKALVPDMSTYPNPLVTAISTAVSTITVTNQLPKVPLTTTIMPNASKSCPAMPTTLISPEDFEQSAKTPQKKMELKQRLLQQNVQPVSKENNTVQTPLNKEQLQLTLVSLLQKDSLFLDTIHEAYLTNFTNNQV